MENIRTEHFSHQKMLIWWNWIIPPECIDFIKTSDETLPDSLVSGLWVCSVHCGLGQTWEAAAWGVGSPGTSWKISIGVLPKWNYFQSFSSHEKFQFFCRRKIPFSSHFYQCSANPWFSFQHLVTNDSQYNSEKFHAALTYIRELAEHSLGSG